MENFKKIDPKALEGNPFALLDTHWALVTAGTPDRFNTMTVSWGGLGWLWRRPVAFTFIRPSRYTYEFVEQNDNFTLSFFNPTEQREALRLLGTQSGRDMDKMHGSGLSVIWPDGQPAFAEASAILVCKRLYSHQIDAARLPQAVLDEAYPGVSPGDLHRAYISEITACYAKA